MKTCWACKLALPLASFYSGGIGKNAYNCRSCESARHKKRNLENKEKKKLEAAMGKIVECRACHKDVNYANLAKTGMLANLVCLSCKRKHDQHKKPHNAEIENGVCRRCAVYGKSDNCIGLPNVNIRSWF